MIAGFPKADIDGYFDQDKPHIKTLIEDQLKKMLSAKIIVTLWIQWKKSVKLAIMLDPENVDCAQDIGNKTGNKNIKVEMPFNNLMTIFFF